MQPYQLSARAPLARCSSFPLKSSLSMQVHDAPARQSFEPEPENWEDFDINSVSGYIARAMPRVYANLEQLENLDEPYLPSQASELFFMVEAVLAARSLIE